MAGYTEKRDCGWPITNNCPCFITFSNTANSDFHINARWGGTWVFVPMGGLFVIDGICYTMQGFMVTMRTWACLWKLETLFRVGIAALCAWEGSCLQSQGQEPTCWKVIIHMELAGSWFDGRERAQEFFNFSVRYNRRCTRQPTRGSTNFFPFGLNLLQELVFVLFPLKP